MRLKQYIRIETLGKVYNISYRHQTYYFYRTLIIQLRRTRNGSSLFYTLYGLVCMHCSFPYFYKCFQNHLYPALFSFLAIPLLQSKKLTLMYFQNIAAQFTSHDELQQIINNMFTNLSSFLSASSRGRAVKASDQNWFLDIRFPLGAQVRILPTANLFLISIYNSGQDSYFHSQSINDMLTINVPVVYMVRYKVVLRGDYP